MSDQFRQNTNHRSFNPKPIRMRRWFVPQAMLFLVALTNSIGCGSRSSPPALTQPVTPPVKVAPLRELTVAAAADLKFVLGEIISQFEKEHSDVKIIPTFGSSGNLFGQISQQAPFDLFLSADLSYPQKLVEQGFADKETLFTYAIGQIVVWVPKNSPLDLETLGAKTFDDPTIQKIAIANPKHAPYGRAAVAAMKELGLYDRVAERLVLGENVAQAAQFIETGAADIGVISLSLANSPELREKGRYWLIPENAYPTMEQGGVIVLWAKERSAAEQFRDFLIGNPGRSLFGAHGFRLPVVD